jgi:hypothetical protein
VVVDFGGGGVDGGEDSNVDFGVPSPGAAGMAEDRRYSGDDSLP